MGGIPDTLTGSFDYGWLGQHQRPVETQAGLQTIEMGARQYLPGLGRFIEVDPVEGGSANDYEYGTADPMNGLDLDGRCWFGRRKGRSQCKGSAFFAKAGYYFGGAGFGGVAAGAGTYLCGPRCGYLGGVGGADVWDKIFRPTGRGLFRFGRYLGRVYQT